MMKWETLRKILLLVLIIFATVLIGRPKFFVRSPEQCRAAIGSLEALTPAEKRAFDPGSDFLPLGTPRAGDWLDRFPEPGQPFSSYVKSTFNPFKAPRNRIYLQPLGSVASGSLDLEDLRDFTARFFAAEVVLLPVLDPQALHLGSRMNQDIGKLQLLTGDIHKTLKTLVASDAYCVLGVTLTDLYPGPGWNFVFGEATLEDRVGVFSFARYDPAFYGQKQGPDVKTLILRRSCKVLAHELVHMFGIWHCVYFQCLENGSNHLDESDSRPLHLCPVCLRKLAFAIGFDVSKRYQALEEFYRRVGINDEADWISRRLKVIQ